MYSGFFEMFACMYYCSCGTVWFFFCSLHSNVTILETKEGIFTKKVGCFRFYAVSAKFQPRNGSAEKASATLHKLLKEVYSRRA